MYFNATYIGASAYELRSSVCFCHDVDASVMLDPNVKDPTSESVVETPTENDSDPEELFLYWNVNESPEPGVNWFVIIYCVWSQLPQE
mgnify:CR=1 FL=1